MTERWTKNNNPKANCLKNRKVSAEKCAVKAGNAQTDTAAKLIYKECKENIITYQGCIDFVNEKYKEIIPKIKKCVDQAYLAD